jgi:thiol:disulfide interchange protein DsbD
MTTIARYPALALIAFVSLSTTALRAEPGDDDPFSDANAASAVKASPRPSSTDKTVDLLQLEASVVPQEVRPGQTVRVTIKGSPKTEYHTYPLTQYSDDPIQGPSGLSKLVFEPSSHLRPLQPVTESTPEFVADRTGVLLEYPAPFTWSQDVLVMPDTPAGEQVLPFSVSFLICNDVRCTPGERRLSVSFRVAGEPIALSDELKKRLDQPAADPRMLRVPDALRSKMSKPETPSAATAEPKATQTDAAPASPMRAGLMQQLGIAMFQGFIMLLTPCVFPMIPITVSFFLKQGEKEHHSPVVLASVYSGTIFLVLTLAVLLLGKLITDLANNAWLNLGMGLLLMFFALSLFGMFDIELPSFLTRYTSAHEGQGGYIGAFFMALTFTINSFTCTGPFIGPLLSGIKELHLTLPELVANAAAYSAGFAGPFFVLALFPRLLKALPKSGGWLNSTKVVMGFVEVALALKFLSITDAGLHPGNPRYFTYDTVLCTWIALCVACGIYLLGLFRLPHDGPVQSIGVPRLMLASFFLGLAVYMSPLLFRHTPQGSIGEFLFAWLPQDSAPALESSGNAASGESGEKQLKWSSDYESSWQEAKKSNKLIFIDFTGVNCQNCRYNEGNVFTRSEVKDELAKFVRVRLYTDQVPDRSLDADQAHKQAKRNQDWQGATFNDVSLPLYIVLDPSTGTSPLTADGKLNGAVKGQASGTILDVAKFVDILRDARGSQVARSD